MKNILVILATFLSINLYSQTIQKVDSVSYVLCEYLKSLSHIKNDSMKFNALIQNRFNPFLQRVDKEKAEQVGNQLYYRLQRNCTEFLILLDKLDPPKDSISRIRIKPSTKLSKNELINFRKRNAFKYYEVNGDMTKVIMRDNVWIDYFADSTYSKLNYKWISESEFELEFLESNNETRTNFSVKGDKFIYRIIDKKSDHYIMSVNIKGQDVYEICNLYFD